MKSVCEERGRTSIWLLNRGDKRGGLDSKNRKWRGGVSGGRQGKEWKRKGCY